MKIYTFNVNGINARLQVLSDWLTSERPDIVCLQELKAPSERFPVESLRECGYSAIWHGQDRWNGVAILGRGEKPEEIRRVLPGDPDDVHSRYIEARVFGLVIGSLYLPNGNPVGSERFLYKLAWLERLIGHARALLAQHPEVVLAGDFNVIPTDMDVFAPERWREDALFRVEVREAFQRLLQQGWIDALRELYPEERIYSFWKYWPRALARNEGLRIDHFLLSPALRRRLVAAGVDRPVRLGPKPSDHAPVWIRLSTLASAGIELA